MQEIYEQYSFILLRENQEQGSFPLLIYCTISQTTNFNKSISITSRFFYIKKLEQVDLENYPTLKTSQPSVINRKVDTNF